MAALQLQQQQRQIVPVVLQFEPINSSLKKKWILSLANSFKNKISNSLKQGIYFSRCMFLPCNLNWAWHAKQALIIWLEVASALHTTGTAEP